MSAQPEIPSFPIPAPHTGDQAPDIVPARRTGGPTAAVAVPVLPAGDPAPAARGGAFRGDAHFAHRHESGRADAR
ncbi:hypothetical protein [Streptomyces sp. NPDC059166]|uniref:hypothetical protein n=1 Tax=Streptomyces sp. NPDC059166 TaxID=3346752 RepID=UPI0036C6232C